MEEGQEEGQRGPGEASWARATVQVRGEGDEDEEQGRDSTDTREVTLADTESQLRGGAGRAF